VDFVGNHNYEERNKVITKQEKIQETGFFLQTSVEKVKPTRVQQKKLSYFLLPVPKVFKATNTTIKMTTNNTSIFIPHIFANISEERIKSVIENAAKYGEVDQIDLVPKKSTDGKAYNSAYIHMKKWNQDEKTQKFLAHLKDTSKQTHIIYDKPWYWIVLENTSSDKKKSAKPLDMKEFPPLAPGAPLTPPGTPQEVAAVWANLREPMTPPRLLNKQQLPGAPTKKMKPVATRNLEKHFAEEDLEDDETMNLVDAGYVYHLEQENTQLRNNNDWFQHENYMMKQEIDRLRSMMMGMVGMGLM
jgi:hypothetical protein